MFVVCFCVVVVLRLFVRRLFVLFFLLLYVGFRVFFLVSLVCLFLFKQKNHMFVVVDANPEYKSIYVLIFTYIFLYKII